MDPYAGQIGNFTATPVHTSVAVPPGQAFQMPGGLYLHPATFYRAWGHELWHRRLERNPGFCWVSVGLPCTTGFWRRRLLDLLLPGWRR